MKRQGLHEVVCKSHKVVERIKMWD